MGEVGIVGRSIVVRRADAEVTRIVCGEPGKRREGEPGKEKSAARHDELRSSNEVNGYFCLMVTEWRSLKSRAVSAPA